MNTLTENRLDASLLTEQERALLPRLQEIFQQGDHPCLKAMDGTEVRLPENIFQMLVKVVEDMNEGRSIVLMPEDETFTTQAAAKHLGMSRQHLVKLLEAGQIPFHRVGSHRRVTFRDLLAFEKQRDAERRSRLGSLFTKLQREGYYDTEYKGDEQ